MSRVFDHSPSVRKVYFICRIENPRKLWDIAGAVDAGLPVFDMAGNAVAVLANQASAEGADEYGGSSSDLFALPLEPVIKSLEQARKRVPEAVRKAEGAKKDAEPVVDPKPGEDKGMTDEKPGDGETGKPTTPPPGPDKR